LKPHRHQEEGALRLMVHVTFLFALLSIQRVLKHHNFISFPDQKTENGEKKKGKSEVRMNE
jgi:hypothetical protein